MTIVIIAICCFVYFVLEKGGLHGPSNEAVTKFGLIPWEISHPGKHCELSQGFVVCQGQGGAEFRPEGQPATIFTLFYAMFMHGGLLHLGGNMLFLWIFGNNVEDSMGRVRYVAFYLLGGIVASLVQVAAHPDSVVPTIGASGAIAAVLGGYAVLYPRARVVTLVFIIIFVTVIELPALLVLGFWFLLQLLDASVQHGPLDSGGVAYFAHIGGFLFGALVIRLFANHVKTDYDSQSRIPVY